MQGVPEVREWHYLIFEGKEYIQNYSTNDPSKAVYLAEHICDYIHKEFERDPSKEWRVITLVWDKYDDHCHVQHASISHFKDWTKTRYKRK